MAKKKKIVSNKKERAILSDVLPYEIPVTFSNKHFHDFLVEYGVELKGDIIKWNHQSSALEEVIKLLFGLSVSDKIANGEYKLRGRRDGFTVNRLRTLPFGYKISHKEKEFRELNVIHPINQLALIEFYEKYKELILYYCGVSRFSIRRPHKVATFTYHKDKTHFHNLAHDHEHKGVEEFDKEYENLKTFFVYKNISNIYKFYESYKYHRCEKKYNKLYKFDISKCFDSIYTHSLSWALLNKDIVKDEIGASRKTFGGRFDTFMQNLNYGETNGIVIGPEFSRVFAELILQQIDINVLRILKDQTPALYHRKNYEIFRYVDDFFLFYNEESTKDEILKQYRLQLKEFKLYISDTKSSQLDKPIITGITRAKLKITDLLNDKLSFKITEEKKEDEEEVEKKYSFYVSSNRLITRFKSIIKETDIAYKDILNYTLACVDRKVHKLIKIYSGVTNKTKYGPKVAKAILEILDFDFFLYSVSPRVNTTIKLCMTLSKVIKFTKVKGNFNHDNRHLIFKKIYDDIFLVLGKYQSSEHTQVETLYLLIALKEMGREYRVDESVLSQYFGIDLEEKKCNNHLNYFSIVVLLFYIENKTRYDRIKGIVKKHIIDRFEEVSQENRRKTTELTLLLFDLLVCPYLDRAFKNKLFTLYRIEGQGSGYIRNGIIEQRKFWFTRWTEFDFGKALEAKKSEEVY